MSLVVMSCGMVGGCCVILVVIPVMRVVVLVPG